MITFSYSNPEQYSLITDTANRIFTMRNIQTGLSNYDCGFFQNLQPKLYASANRLPSHMLAFDGERLVGMAAVKQRNLIVGGESLNLFGIGTVGVLPEYRGRGIMKEMMNRILHDIREQGADLAELGGKRKRYAHFGFYTAGGELNMTILREELSDIPQPGYEFSALPDHDPALNQWLQSLHEKNWCYGAREPSAYPDFLRTGGRNALLITLSGEKTGYLSVSSDYGSIAEIEAENEIDIPKILRAYCDNFDVSQITLHNFSPFEVGKMKLLLGYSTVTELCMHERYRIFNYIHFLQANLRAKNEKGGLYHGHLNICIEHFGTVSVKVDQTVSVEMTEQIADLFLTEEEVVQLTMGFSPLLAFQNEKLPCYARSWFPFQIHSFACDRI